MNLTHHKKLSIFIAISIITSLLLLSKLLRSETKEIYIVIKASQGLWWTRSESPKIWYINSIKKGDFEKDITGNKIAEVAGIEYYPTGDKEDLNQFELYTTLKISASYDQKSDTYKYNRSLIAIGLPIDIQLNSALLPGTVINISDSPIMPKYKEKILVLTQEFGYSKDNEYYYESIPNNDKYFNGNEYVFEVLDKYLTKRNILASNNSGYLIENIVSNNQHIVVEAKILVEEKYGNLMFGPEQILTPGSRFKLITPNYNYSTFYIAEIKDPS